MAPTERTVEKPNEPKPTVLVVEDDPDTRTLMTLVLRKDYRVVAAPNARSARAELRAHARSVRLILMDLRLPGPEDGLALTRSLRRTSRWQRIPIVAATACATAEDEAEARRGGCTDYLRKPFYPQELLSAVKRNLSGGSPGGRSNVRHED
jgi:CheY-like chemotaxis protein